ncbi:mechanosensitive ion channel protein [Mucilaginibacter conchicola]|uniref:Mechanosensitive ion channel protein n=1 Tax=Mucilaginibacter conchicola TaxID=2303333 RepID=A0A372NXB4_9SPHI|nr:mechanosensitive ion channel domain-containing protein [Mucilaginibacter conchicola]RFZ94758.1 mechanosensitive ion channel protein [Mucilaginibacter conchicola]
MKLTGTSIKAAFLLFFSIIISTAAFTQAPTLKSDSGQTIPDTLLFRIQRAQAAITEINASNKKGYATGNTRQSLSDIRQNIAPIKADLTATGRVIEPKTLTSYDLILKTSQDNLQGLQDKLSKASNDLQRMANEVLNLSKDSVLMVQANDTTARKLYKDQLIDIKVRLQNAGKLTTANLDTVSRLLADVSASNLQITELQANISDRMQVSGKSALRKESPYIWAAPIDNKDEDVGELLSSSIRGQNKILGYFINSTWDNRILVILFGGVFFLWVFLNYRKAQKPDLKQNLGTLDFKYISAMPVIPALIVMLIITPLFEPDSPSLYIEIISFGILALLTIDFWKKLEPKQLRQWLYIVGLYILVMAVTATVHDAIFVRLLLIGVNVASLYIGYRFYQKLKEINFKKGFIKPVLYVFFYLNIMAIILNVFGRISLAKIYSITGIVGLTQVIGLAIFIQILTDALELQIKISSCNGGIFSRLDVSKTRQSFQRMLSVIAVILWLLVFFINLNVAGGVFSFFHQVLVKERVFGTLKFTLGNVLFFIIIVYVSNILQKNIGVLFGEKTIGYANNKVEHKSSKLTLFRLVIVLLGLLLAFTASGIPMDKLTVVLGALSVGIGLGMQNIVNNFVSGIILIFEKPFEIGDFIELADKKGKIQDIGIRSSKMLTQYGSQVIIPNGDLLSNRLVNWTQGASYVKSELIFKVNIATDINALTKIIEDQISKTDHTVKNMSPEVLINAITADSMEIKILIWVTSVYVEPAFKSKLLLDLMPRFTDAQIKVM